MSTIDEALSQKPAEDKPKNPSKAAGITVNLIVTAAFWAFLAWLAGVALHRGFGVSAPFIPSTLLLVAFGTLVKGTASMVADTWHASRVKADTAFMVGQMMAQQAIQQQNGGGLSALLDLLKPPGESGDPGSSPYL